jgi:hypothetical protein
MRHCVTTIEARCVRACVNACVSACVCACVRVCVRVRARRYGRDDSMSTMLNTGWRIGASPALLSTILSDGANSMPIVRVRVLACARVRACVLSTSVLPTSVGYGAPGRPLSPRWSLI